MVGGINWATPVSGSSQSLRKVTASKASRRAPPSVGEVLRLDPTLMTNPAYLASYPALQTFLAAHPDVLKNPGYYFDRFEVGYYQPPATQILREILSGGAALSVFGTIVTSGGSGKSSFLALPPPR